MSLRTVNIGQLTEWLGPEGGVAGLDKSRLTNAELMQLARINGIEVGPKTPRRQLVIELVMSPIKRVDRKPDQLLEMSKAELQRYFSDRMVSSRELKAILESMGIAPTGKLRAKLSDFAANEISDLGMFQRVAKGHAGRNPPR